MPLKNYTTEVPTLKSVGEIQGNLVAHGATDILVRYAGDHEPESLSFIIPTKQGNMPFRLPANKGAVERLLAKSYDPNYRKYDSEYQRQHKERLRNQASRVAWRILKDWVDAQLAIIETEMVTIEQVFLPYMQINKDGMTLYEVMEKKGFQLPEGRG